ncbi:hypothetical protein [Erythrobacter sanguineus]|uniref:Uncharacterized protein n=1 Tax=Erythrobacter sanguineus TaxID=198312 RepID=A0A1M7S768_9SPHN|nr:hypothetical protein [Erythrobacter sanguineus]SHN54280.1 hypothetical protein SAMN02745193_01142 [Erythrobacter sanguineus]
MKFIKLESRGGNYLVVAENVAWLRTAENGQTSVGIIGGQPLLVVGTVEEVAEKILTASSSEEQPVAAPPPAPAPVPEHAPEPAPAPAPEPVREVEIEKAVEKPPAERPRPIAVKTGMTLSERLAAGGPPRVKAGSQRFMGGLE